MSSSGCLRAGSIVLRHVSSAGAASKSHRFLRCGGVALRQQALQLPRLTTKHHFASAVVPATPIITNHGGKGEPKINVTVTSSSSSDESSSDTKGKGKGNKRRIVERKAPLTIVRFRFF